MPTASISGLPSATVTAKLRKATPRAEPMSAAECSGSIGSNSVVWMSCAMLLRSTKLMLVVVMARRQIRNSRRLFAAS